MIDADYCWPYRYAVAGDDDDVQRLARYCTLASSARRDQHVGAETEPGMSFAQVIVI